ncbi:MAG: radical SAM protein [Pseudomonadota bacterium]
MKETDPFIEAWNLSRTRYGFDIIFYQPGMFVVDGKRGAYPAASITGPNCELNCSHCDGKLLENMVPCFDGAALVNFAKRAEAKGDKGILVSGGCDRHGSLPWPEFTEAIRQIHDETNLVVTIHTGQIDLNQAQKLKDAGVKQALIDVLGSDSTAKEIFHLTEGITSIVRSLDALHVAGLEVVPHIVHGIHYGTEKGEMKALEIISNYPVSKYVIVVFTPLKGTKMAWVKPPTPLDVASFIAKARMTLPHMKCSLGCARPGGRYRKELDRLAIRAGINSMAVGSDESIFEATKLGLNVIRKFTCCSLD